MKNYKLTNLKAWLLSLFMTIVILPSYATRYTAIIGNIVYMYDTNKGTAWVAAGEACSGSVTICETLTSGNSTYYVTSIDAHAFEGSNITSITIPYTIKSIGIGAFRSCNNLKEVHISDLLIWCNIKFGDNPLRYAHNLYLDNKLVTDLEIPDCVPSIADYAFRGCTSLTSVIIPNSVKDIGNYAFQDCSGLTSVTIPNSITSIGSNTFDGCSGLTSVTIPNSVTSIGSNAFNGCTGLNQVHISDMKAWCNIKFNSVTDNPLYYAHNLYLGDELVTDLEIPDGVTSIGYALSGCSSLTSVAIPNSLKDIGDYSFSGCSGLTSVTFPNSVRSIGRYAFNGCNSLTSLTFPNSVTSIGRNAFNGCDHLCQVHISDLTAWCKIDFGDNPLRYAHNLYIGDKLVTDLKIPDKVTSIGASAFYGCSSLTSVLIPNSVKDIGSYSFQDCSGLTSVTIPSSVTSINGYAFYGCSSLNQVHISDLTAWCKIDFSDNPLRYAHNLYVGNELVTDLEIPDGIATIDYAFNGCSSLNSVTIPNSVIDIGNYAFNDCSGLTSVTIPTSVRSIGRHAFGGCCGLTSLTIPNSVASIGEAAFDGCSALTSVTIPNSVTSIGAAAFSDCSALTSVSIPNYVATIGYNIFCGCSSLTSAIIPSTVTSIFAYAFYGCSNLTSVYCLNPTPPSISTDSFSHYDATLYVPIGSKYEYLIHTVWRKFNNVEEFDPAGIEDVEAHELMTSTEYYNLNGIRVANSVSDEQPSGLAPGIYLTRKGNKTDKVIIR